MARIRSIKPEFFDSPGTAKASLFARLLYIAMWCWADDWGIGDANPRRLLGFAFPDDDASEVEPRNFRHIAAEVSDCYGVQWYEVGGREFYAIPSWERHQRTEKRAKQRFPGPDQAERFLYTETAELPTLNLGSSVVGTGEQGNRGTGEGTTLLTADAASDRPTTPAEPKARPISGPSRFDEFWAVYPRKVGKDKARTAYRAACRRADEQTVIDGARRLAADPNLPEPQFIPHPTTWLARGGWDDEPLPPREGGAIGRQVAAPRYKTADEIRREREEGLA